MLYTYLVKKSVFRKSMKLYKGIGKWENVINVKVSGQMANGHKTYEFDGCDKECTYMMFRDKINGEYLMII